MKRQKLIKEHLTLSKPHLKFYKYFCGIIIIGNLILFISHINISHTYFVEGLKLLRLIVIVYFGLVFFSIITTFFGWEKAYETQIKKIKKFLD